MTGLIDFDEQPIEEVIQHDPRPGPEPKFQTLSKCCSNEHFQSHQKNTDTTGPAWNSQIVQQYLHDEFGTEYTRRHIRHLMKEAGFSWQLLILQSSTADSEEHEVIRGRFRDEVRIVYWPVCDDSDRTKHEPNRMWTSKNLGAYGGRAPIFPTEKRTMDSIFWVLVSKKSERSLQRSQVRSSSA